MAGVVEAVTGSRWRALGVGIVLGLALLAAALPLTAFGGGGDSHGEIFLEPAEQIGPDPFTDALFVTPVSIAAVLPQGMDELDDGISALTGDDVGLYGGTKDNARCDADLLIAFLTNPRNRYKAAAWASVHGLDVDEIGDYIDGLTPMVLRQDVRVTNHGFRDGQARPLQSVLEAGTAVLVDDQGIPRVRCACGNPLLEPEAVSGEVTYEGEPWAGFDVRALFRMTPGEIEERFILVDLPTGNLFERPIGGDGSTDRFLGEEDDDEEEGVDDLVVPDVTGLTLDAAIDALEERSLKVLIVEKADDDVPPGRVIVTDPPAGAFADPDVEVLVIVSTGPEQPPAGPSTTTTTTAVVEETSTTASTLPQTTTTARPTTQPPPPPPPPPPPTTTTTIRRTTTTIRRTTTTIRRTTTTASTTTTVQKVTVPNVVGLPLGDARARLQTAGLQVEPVSTAEPPAGAAFEAGQVIAQDPPGQALVDRNSVVVITWYDPLI